MKPDYLALQQLAAAATSKKIVRGLTHDFYNYPARFSPDFVRESIRAFTQPGDLILDPFMGGGTALVESKVLSRHSIGFDISSLAHFIAKVKVTSLSKREIATAADWSNEVIPELKCRGQNTRPEKWIDAGYHRHMSESDIWPIRVLMEKFIFKLERSTNPKRVKDFLRAALLKTGQWAIDSKKVIPTTANFRERLQLNINAMLEAVPSIRARNGAIVVCKNKSATKIHTDQTMSRLGPPKLVLTSPPYPGVHVMYHRWQVKSRRETAAPFWIANSLDGHGHAHYTMGNRHENGLTTYFDNILEAFTSVSQVCNKDTIVVQMIAFSDLSWQLERYLKTMSDAGFDELHFYGDRLWRYVPNRKWYAQQKGNTSSSKEVVLFHKLKHP
jgi:hypothetical protein